MSACLFECPHCRELEAQKLAMIQEVRPDYGESVARFGLLVAADVDERSAQASHRALRRAPTWDIQAQRAYRERELARISTLVQESQDNRASLVAYHQERLLALNAELERRAKLPRHYQANALWDGQFIADLKSRLTVTALAGQQFPIARHMPGADWALCPFHNEKTPSLELRDDGFHCFGCGEHGDLFDLVEKLELADSFSEAVRWVANYVGIEMPVTQRVLDPEQKIVAPSLSAPIPVWERSAL